MKFFGSVPMVLATLIGSAALGGAALVPMPFAIEAVKPKIENKIKLVVQADEDSKPETLQIDDLKIGQTKDVITESGKHAVVTRNAKGFEIKIDGKEIHLPKAGEHGKCVVKVRTIDEGGDKKVVRMKSCRGKKHGGEGSSDDVVIESRVFGQGNFDFDSDEDDMFGASAGRHAFAFSLDGGNGPFCLPGCPPGCDSLSKMKLDDLASLKGVDEKTKAKVKEALAEIAQKWEKACPVRHKGKNAAFDGDKIEKRVKVIVVTDDDDDEDEAD